MAQPTHRYILKWSKMIAPKVLHLGFAREDNATIPFTAGQFITIHIQGPHKILHRSYSIANMPNHSKEIEIAVSYVEGGVASTLLFNLKPGEHIDASGPFGIFTLKEEKPKRYVLIATGTGVSPYRAMLGDLKQRLLNEPLQVELLQGVRTKEELLFGPDFVQMANELQNFRFNAFYSREALINPHPHERKGYVQDAFSELKLNPLEDIVYLCGNPNMIDDSFTKLTELGFERKSVRREKYLFSH